MALADRGAQLLDSRDPVEFAAAHLAGSINIGLGGQYATWAGTLLDRERPIVIIAAPGRETEAALRLGRIGFDNVAGYLKEGLQSLASRPDLSATTERLSATFASELLESTSPPICIDVRTPRERSQKHITGSISMPLNHLDEHLNELPPKSQPILVHCAGGYRSSIAASILQSHGFEDVSEIAGGIAAWESAALPVVSGARAGCGSTLGRAVGNLLAMSPIRLIAAILFTSVLPALAASDHVIDVTKAGVVGDGATLNTTSIQKTIDDCSAGGGGVVRFPAGRYLTGTIQIKSNVTLQFDEQATLLGSTDAKDYRNLDPFIDGSGNPMGHALVVAVDADHVGIEGTGTIDGQGKKLAEKQNPYVMRPFLVRWVRCTNVTLRDIHLANPGAWTLNFFQSKDVDIDHVTIRSRDQHLRNNDGVNIDSSENIRVRNCDVISGDDALVIKSTSDKPSRDIVASDCKLSTRTNAIKLGTESFGGFENISISNCQITDTGMSGIALYEVDGANLHNVTVSDVTIDGVSLPISIRLGVRFKTFREGQKPRTGGTLRDVTIKNVTAKNIRLIGMLINGVPDHPIEALTLQNIHLDLAGGGNADAAKVLLPEKESAYPEFNMFGKTMPAYGIYARHVRGLKLDHITMNPLKPDARPATIFVDVKDVTPADFPAELSQSR